jgi:hypothetical protein
VLSYNEFGILLQFLQHQKLEQQKSYRHKRKVYRESSTANKSSEDRSNGQVKVNIKECPSYHSSSQELKKLKVYASVITYKQIVQNLFEGCLEVVLSVPFKLLLQHMINAYNSNNNKTDRLVQTRKLLMSVGSVFMSVNVPPCK